MKVDIIGGGIAGLSAGIYLQQMGFSTTVYEAHSDVGGLCTGWQRGDYTFNGCIHWLLGAQDGISFYHFWREIIDIDSINFFMPDERVVFELPMTDNHGCNQFHYYTDIDRFEHYLLDIAPEDKHEILQWTSAVRFIMPYLDYLPPVFPKGFFKGLLFKMKLAKLLPVLPFMRRWGRLSNTEYASRFSNDFLREGLCRLYDSPMRMTVLLFAQAYAAKHVAQYPLGGSLHFSHILGKKYTDVGGTIRTNCRVNSISTNHDVANGLVLANGETTHADFVISAADWHWTVFDALNGQYVNKKISSLRNPDKDLVYFSYCRLFLGIKTDMNDAPHFSRFLTDPITMPDGTTYDHLEVEVYNYDHSLAPDGKVTMAVNLLTREGQWWINLRQNDFDGYRKAKQQLQNDIISRLTSHFGNEWHSNIEVVDLCTPASYHRFTSNLYGSSQGWTPLNNIMSRLPISDTLPDLRNFFMVGQWMEAGGGLPVALYSARKVAHKIAKLNHR